MKPVSYRIVEFQPAITINRLTPHPAASVPTADDDLAQLGVSVEAHGVCIPLIVMPNGSDYQILDGCTRYQQAIQAGRSTLPCVVVNCLNPRDFVLENLRCRRKATAGQKILAYLEQHKEQVLEAHDSAKATRLQNLKKGQCFPKQHDVASEKWSAEEIAKRIECSEPDVLLGIELMIAADQSADDASGAAVKAARDRVFSGEAPIRRWKAAVAGKTAGGGKGKASADYLDKIPQAATTLANGFRAWAELDWNRYSDTRPKYREEVCEKIFEMLDAMPDEVRSIMRGIVCEHWSQAEQKRLKLFLNNK